MREAVMLILDCFEVSERRACKILKQPRASQRYLPNIRDVELPLTQRIIELACMYGRYSYRRIAAMLRLEGWRVNHKHEGVIIVVTQRLSADDLTAHLLKQEGWEVLSLPAIAIRDEHLPRSLGGNLARRKGEAMHPVRENREDLRTQMLRMGARAFCAQYQQDPYPNRHHRGGVYHTAPHSDHSAEEYKDSAVFFAQLPEELFVLDRVFGEHNSFPAGPAPMMSTEEWIERHGGMQINRTA